MTKNLTCISCPYGCSLKATIDETTGEITVEGNRCPAGEKYAKRELVAPVRIVTTTVPLKGKDFDRLPVKTSQPIDKKLIHRLMEVLVGVEAEPPVKQGDVIVKNVLDSQADIIACADK